MRKFLVVSVVALLLVIALVSAFAVLRTPSVVSADMGREHQIREASRAWDEAFNVEDLDGLMALYADGAVSMAPGFPASEGKEAIHRDIAFLFADADLQHETTIVELLISGNISVERGTYTMTADGSLVEAGKHIVVRQKVGNAWLVVWEIWNTNG